MGNFKALVVNKDDNAFTVDIQQLNLDDLPEGEVKKASEGFLYPFGGFSI